MAGGESAVPRRLEPQLLVSVKEAPAGEGWIHEVKYDGYRLMARVLGGRVCLVTRGGHDWTERMPEVRESLEALALEGAWLDGEVVVLREDGHPDFRALERAIRSSRRPRPPFVYQVWDAPWLGGEDLTALPLLERKARLRASIGRGHGAVRYVDHMTGSGPALWREVCETELEGIVSKRAASPYRPGVRSRDWVKVKCFRPYRLRVAGLGEGMDGILLALAEEDGRLRYVGRAAWPSGAKAKALHGALAGLEREGPALEELAGRGERVRWVEPRVEVEVAALALSPGDKLRHATVRRVLGKRP